MKERSVKTYQGGEELFALRITEYPELNKTRKELNLLDQLYGLYMDVVNTMDEYRNMCMTELIERMEEMTGKVNEFDVRCSKMPRKLRDWEAYTALRTDITDFQSNRFTDFESHQLANLTDFKSHQLADLTDFKSN